jgi:hypothetical protein
MNRITPLLPAGAMKTFQILQPLHSHFRQTTCAEADCVDRARGWTSLIDVGTDLGRQQANYIRLRSGRAFTATEVGTLVTFVFPPGQDCFTTHQVPLERPQIFVVRDGDWRGNPRRTEPRRHATGADWVDDFANHQGRLADAAGRG